MPADAVQSAKPIRNSALHRGVQAADATLQRRFVRTRAMAASVGTNSSESGGSGTIVAEAVPAIGTGRKNARKSSLVTCFDDLSSEFSIGIMSYQMIDRQELVHSIVRNH